MCHAAVPASPGGRGGWTRACDYSLYRDPNGRFHVIPWDANETYREPERMGPRRGEIPDGVALDPFAGSSDPDKAPFRLLMAPSLRTK